MLNPPSRRRWNKRIGAKYDTDDKDIKDETSLLSNHSNNQQHQQQDDSYSYSPKHVMALPSQDLEQQPQDTESKFWGGQMMKRNPLNSLMIQVYCLSSSICAS